MTDTASHGLIDGDQSAALESALDDIISRCTQCGTCVNECLFLQRFGTPYGLAEQFSAGKLDPEVPFFCSLCRLCRGVCPEKLNGGDLFWLMRCELSRKKQISYRHHRAILNYERLGLSGPFSHFELPRGCKTIFFPGCTFSGSRPKQVTTLIPMLEAEIPDLGVVLSCCAKPSHDLGRYASFRRDFDNILSMLLDSGVESVLTVCPSCYQIFKDYGTGLKVKSVYEVLDETWSGQIPRCDAEVTVHDPCSVRFHEGVRESVRGILVKMGVRVTEMAHHGERAWCCGEGGSACFMPGSTAGQMVAMRREEAKGLPVISYCAGCSNLLGRQMHCAHLTDLLLSPEESLADEVKPSRSPFTYFNRLLLKWSLKRKAVSPKR